MIAEILISSNAKDLNRIFDYNVPTNFVGTIMVGSKVLIPFGNMKKIQEGFVVGFKEESEYKVKDILKVENIGGLTEQKIILAKLMSNKYFCNVADCIKLMLPPGTTSKNMENRIKDKEMRFVYLKKDEEEIQECIEKKSIKSEKQIRTLNFLINNDEVMVQELIDFADTTSAVIKTLEKNGYVEIIKKEVNRNPFKNKKIAKTQNLELTSEQFEAMKKIQESIDMEFYKEFLIHGVTGSRKD